MRQDSTVTDLANLFEKAKVARARFEPTWYLNLAYYSGNQWLYWNRGRLYEPKLDPWRVTFTDNRLIGIVRTEVAKMTKQRPIFTATPTTGAEEDLAAAQLSERMLRFAWDEFDLQRKQRAALMWARTCSAGFWKICWDPSVGDKRDVVIGPDGQIVMGQDQRPMDPQMVAQLPPELQQQLKIKTVAQGDVHVSVRNPFQMFLDPLANDEGMSSAEWCIEETVMSQDYVKERYGVEVQVDAEASGGMAEGKLSGPLWAEGGNTSYKGVRLREYWSKDKHAVWAGKKLLLQEDNAYKKLPYVMFGGIPVPGRFWPTSTVEQLRGPQTELNKTRSQIRENAARLGNPALLKSRMSNVEYTGLPGEVIEFDDVTQNAAPGYLTPPPMPAYVVDEPDRIADSMREISGQHEVTGASVPPGVTAASAINLLQEADDTRIGPDIADMETTIATAGDMVLKLIAEYYTDERTVRIAGEDGDWDIFDFRGSMIAGSTHVQVQAGSAIPLSKAAKQAAIRDTMTLFIQNGIQLPQRQLAGLLKDMDVGGFDRMLDQLNSDEIQVNSEQRRMAQGMLLPINSYDDDQAHVDLHTEFQKTNRYQRMEQPVQMIFEQHVAAHRQRMAQVQEQQLRAQVEMESAIAKAQAEAHPQPQNGDRAQA